MSCKVEFINALVTKIDWLQNELILLAIEDARTFGGKTKVHKFNVLTKTNTMVDCPNLMIGDNVVIEASLLSKEYEHQNETKYSMSIWASKIYKLAKDSTPMVKKYVPAPIETVTDNQEIPF
jgi:hypothetical protein